MKDIDMPCDLEAEMGALGSAIVEPERVIPMLPPPDAFYDPQHRTIARFLTSMDGTIDLLTLGVELRNARLLDAVGGYPFLESLIDATPTSAHAEYYIEIVNEKSDRRDLIDNALDSATKCSEGGDLDEIASGLASALVGVTRSQDEEQDNETIMGAHEEAMRGNPNSVPLPFPALTRRTGGVRKKMVTILTGRTKSGKSMFKGLWHRHLGELGMPALDCCFEDKWHIAKARAASIGQYSLAELDAGGRYVLSGDKWEWWTIRQEVLDMEREALAHIDTLPMYWYGKKVDVHELRTVIAFYKRKYDIQAVFIDGAKDMKKSSGQHNDCGAEEEISQAFTEIAYDLNLAMIPIHHLTKIDDGELIKLNHIRGSGNIASDARAVYALQSKGLDKYFNPQQISIDEEGYETTRVLECIANNHGKEGKVWLESDLNRCDFWCQGDERTRAKRDTKPLDL